MNKFVKQYKQFVFSISHLNLVPIGAVIGSSVFIYKNKDLHVVHRGVFGGAAGAAITLYAPLTPIMISEILLFIKINLKKV